MAIVPLNNEDELLAAIAYHDDQYAFRKIFDHYQSYVFTFAQKTTKSTSEAEEIVQDIFLKIWFNREKLTSIMNFGAYLNRSVRNHTLNLLRHQATTQRVHESVELQPVENMLDTEQALDYKETKRMLDDAIEQLTDKQRQVYLLCHEQGLKYDDVAKKLQISPDTVHYHMKLALSAIRTHFKRHAMVYPGLMLFFF